MMTPQEFQKRYHGYEAPESVAKKEAEKINREGILGEEAVAVTFSGRWSLMLKSAYEFVKDPRKGGVKD